jgi:hypothetical protein
MLIRRTMLALAAFAVAASAQSAAESERRAGCTNASVRGTFAFTANGFTVPGSPLPPALQGRFASGGTSVFDGRGSVTLNATSSFNGIVQGPVTAKGTYTVSPDCTYVSALDNGATFRAVIVNDGRELYILQTNAGVIITGTALRQDTLKPTLDDLRSIVRPFGCRASQITEGVYGFISDGAAGPPTIPAELAGPLAGVGTVAFSARGTFDLRAQRSVNGNIDPEIVPLTGTYTFNPDCTFRMTFDVVGFTFNGMVADGGRQLLFVETNPGTTFVVKAKRI